MNTYKINSHVNTEITLFDLFAAQTYRTPKIVTEIHVFKDNYFFPVCPRCKITIEREYQTFCDRCGQHLDWSDYDNAEIKYIGWNGPDDN